ncbi:MAG TPA: hypothetical protein VHL77_08735 [Ferruginibacter sp.]|jgi:hypothetical protein|nr:hypothetical protein [Ferruginibacter sp.]
MNQDNPADVLNYDVEKKSRIPAGLNVLTILTIIGCAWELYSSVSNFFGGKRSLEELEKNQEKLAEAPAWAKKFAGPEVHEMMVQAINNKVPLLIIGTVATLLCFYGALQMRKLKKEGYILWLIGEVLPYISTAIFLPAFYNTIFIYFAIVPAIFIILYTTQRKHLVN